LHRRPGAGVFNVPPEFLKAERSIWTPEQIDAAVVMPVLDASQHDP
jgi:hypothetical protein